MRFERGVLLFVQCTMSNMNAITKLRVSESPQPLGEEINQLCVVRGIR
jgi:hypothetical protein